MTAFYARHPVVVWTGLVAALCLTCIAFVDKPLTLFLAEVVTPEIHDVFEAITHVGNSAIWYVLAVSGALACLCIAGLTASEALHYRYRRYARAWGFMILSMLTSGILVNVLKVIFGRFRPRYLFDDNVYGFEPFNFAIKMMSFPSGHSQAITSAAVALMFLFPRLTPVYLIVAVLVASSRVILVRPHFLADIIAGAFVGVVITVLMHRYFTRAPGGASVQLKPLEDGR